MKEEIVNAISLLVNEGLLNKAQGFDMLTKDEKPQVFTAPTVSITTHKGKAVDEYREKFIKENYNLMKAKEIARKLGVKIHFVYITVKKLGLKKYKQGKKSTKTAGQKQDKKDYDNFIIENNDNLTNEEMAEKIGMEPADIEVRKNFLKRIGKL